MEEAIESNQDLANVELNNIVQNLALLGKQIQRSFHKRPTNNNLRTTYASTALNKRQDIPPRGEVVRQGVREMTKLKLVKSYRNQSALAVAKKVILLRIIQMVKFVTELTTDKRCCWLTWKKMVKFSMLKKMIS